MSAQQQKRIVRLQLKQDTTENWNKASNATPPFVPLKGEFIVYTDFEPMRLKLGDGENTPDGLDWYAPAISGTVTKALGGIGKDKVYNNTSIVTVLEDLLFPYVAPSKLEITLDQKAGTYEYGTEHKLTAATIKFAAGSKPITSIKIGTSKNGEDLYSDNQSEYSNGPIALSVVNQTFDGTSDKTIYVTISDGETSLSGSAAITFAQYNYVIVSNSPDSIEGGNKQNLKTDNKVDSLQTTDNTYIWFLVPTQKTTIQQYAMSQWNSMNTTYQGRIDFTTDQNKTLQYHAYRTDKMAAATGKYQII